MTSLGQGLLVVGALFAPEVLEAAAKDVRVVLREAKKG